MTKDYYTKPLKNDEIEELAAAWRDALEIPTFCAAANVLFAVENKLPELEPAFALLVEPDQANDDIEAYTEFDPPRIVVRQKVYNAAADYDGRARFTIAHELGHFVLHEAAVPTHRAPVQYQKMENLPAYASVEKQADKFAAAFLIPRWIAEDLGTIDAVSNECKVSPTAARVRLKRLGIVERKTIPEPVTEFLAKIKKK